MNGDDGKVDAESVEKAVAALQEAKFETVLIGANALLMLGFGATTYDIDIGVRRRDFAAIEKALKGLGWRTEIIGNAMSASRAGVDPIELVHVGPFGPPSNPDEFFEYLRDDGSVETRVGRVAVPAAVWYMRLAFEPITGRQKILQDIRLKLLPNPPRLLDDVLALAKRMERLEEVEPHVLWLREQMK